MGSIPIEGSFFFGLALQLLKNCFHTFDYHIFHLYVLLLYMYCCQPVNGGSLLTKQVKQSHIWFDFRLNVLKRVGDVNLLYIGELLFQGLRVHHVSEPFYEGAQASGTHQHVRKFIFTRSKVFLKSAAVEDIQTKSEFVRWRTNHVQNL